MEVAGQARYSISEAAQLLDRSAHTLRSWDRNKSMPRELRPKRNRNGHRYWTDELIEKIKEWIEENAFHPGSGIDYHPDEAQLKSHIGRIRRSSQAKVKSHPAKSPYEDVLVADVIYALEDLKVTPSQIVSTLPAVMVRYPGLALDDALQIVASILAEYE